MFFIRVSFMACLLVSDFLFYSSLGFGLLSFCSVLPWWFVSFFYSPRFAPRFFLFLLPPPYFPQTHVLAFFRCSALCLQVVLLLEAPSGARAFVFLGSRACRVQVVCCCRQFLRQFLSYVVSCCVLLQAVLATISQLASRESWEERLQWGSLCSRLEQ